MHLARGRKACECRRAFTILPGDESSLYWVGFEFWIIYFEKIRVFKAGYCYEYISME